MACLLSFVRLAYECQQNGTMNPDRWAVYRAIAAQSDKQIAIAIWMHTHNLVATAYLPHR
jgi:hypothetical protein